MFRNGSTIMTDVDQVAKPAAPVAQSSPMPRYFLHVHKTIEWTDEEGLVLPDLATARRGAIEGIRMIAAKGEADTLDPDHCVLIANEHGQTLMTVPFHAALAPQTAPADTLH